MERAFLVVSLGKLVVHCYPLGCQIDPREGFLGVLGVRKLFADGLFGVLGVRNVFEEGLFGSCSRSWKVILVF